MANCPLCGSPMWPSRRWRIRGWFGLLFGLAVALGTLVLLAKIAPLMDGRPEPVDAAEIDPQLARMVVYALVGLVLLLGLTMAIGGLRQIATGRRDRGAAMIGLAIAALIMFGGAGLVLFLGGDVPRPLPRMR